MSLAEDRGLATARRWLGGRLAILVAALVFAALGFAGMLPVPYAVAGFAVVTAAIFAMRTGTDDDRRAQPVAIAAPGDGLLRALVAGLPDPVVALDRDGRVLALNDRARALAPALRQGEPVAFALRMPELIEAISRAKSEGGEERCVFS